MKTLVHSKAREAEVSHDLEFRPCTQQYTAASARLDSPALLRRKNPPHGRREEEGEASMATARIETEKNRLSAPLGELSPQLA